MWSEENFDINSTPYTKEAYEAKKYAFVSDYVRLWALEREGGLYMDVDIEVFQSFNPLLTYKAFAGFEGRDQSRPPLAPTYAKFAKSRSAKNSAAILASEALSGLMRATGFSAGPRSFSSTTGVLWRRASRSRFGCVLPAKMPS